MEYIWAILILLASFGLFVLLLRWYLADFWRKSRQELWFPNENCYIDPNEHTRIPFPSINENPSVYLSVIIPAYNEKDRLSTMLDETLDHLEKKHQINNDFTYELIIVDDGSKDNTSDIALKYSKEYTTEKIRVLKLHQNRGKGGAVKRGMLCGRGQVLLFADADGASKFSDIDKLDESLRSISASGFGISVGSRNVKNTNVTKTLFRWILTWGFHFGVELLCVKGVKDTQCGFKLFTRLSAATLFSILHIERWAFDVELLYLAQYFGMPISEVGITWNEVDGSKVNPFWDSLKMAQDVVLIRLMYILGIWKHEASRMV